MPSILIDTNTDGATLVAARSAREFIRVHSINITAAAQVEISLLSNSTVVWKTYASNDPAVVGGIVLAPGQVIDCDPGEALKIGLDGAVGVAGSLDYTIHGQAW